MSRKPIRIQWQRQSRVLRVEFGPDQVYSLPAEFLRVHSPSAEVQGHGEREPLLVPGKREVSIQRIEPVGRYAVRLVFTDGHDTGLYSWDVLEQLGREQDRLWPLYLQRLETAGMSRDSDVVKLSQLGKAKTYKPS